MRIRRERTLMHGFDQRPSRFDLGQPAPVVLVTGGKGHPAVRWMAAALERSGRLKMMRPAYAGTAGVVIVLFALLALAAGSASAKSGKAAAQGGTLNIDFTTDIDYTDPALD